MDQDKPISLCCSTGRARKAWPSARRDANGPTVPAGRRAWFPIE
jgi:hypothetical protein